MKMGRPSAGSYLPDHVIRCRGLIDQLCNVYGLVSAAAIPLLSNTYIFGTGRPLPDLYTWKCVVFLLGDVHGVDRWGRYASVVARW